MHRAIRKLIRAYSGAVSTSLDLEAGLDAICRATARLFAATRTAVWLHDRQSRELRLTASSDRRSARGTRVGCDDPQSIAARGFRRTKPRLTAQRDATWSVVVPLSGRRRALGTVVIEGIPADAWDRPAVVTYATELGLETSLAVENVQLLHDVIQSRRELENTFNSITDLVAVCDADLRLMLVNEAFASRVGRPRGSLVDRPLADFVGRQVCEWVAALHRADTSRFVPARETTDDRLGGIFSVTLSRVLRPSGMPAGVVVVARDVTERARHEAERAALRDRLVQSEKLAALGQFVSGIAHELNNPLQAVIGHIDLLRTVETLSPGVAQDFKTIAREAERAAQIIRNLLTFVGARPITRRPVHLNGLVTRAVAARRAAYRAATVEVVTTLDPSIPRIAGEPLLLIQALLNILQNAELAVGDRARRRIEITTRHQRRAKTATVRIRDTGVGIPPDTLPRVFEPFFTTREVGSGTGLGLAIAYGIITDHGGTIAAANDRGGGAAFTVTLPAPGRRGGKSRENSVK